MSVVENKQREKTEIPPVSLVEQMQRLPLRAFTRMRLLTPQQGCPNACGFCSQSAKATHVRFTEKGLNDLFGAIKTVASSLHRSAGPFIGGWRHEERRGVIHPYYDNDVGSYPYLDTYIRHVDDLGAKTAISTVGWSRHNPELQAMHERIAGEMGTSISGVRFSWTPYTYGWTEAAQHSGLFSRADMIADFANSLKTYKPLVEQHGTGENQLHTQIRFRPVVEAEKTELTDTFISGHHVIQSGPYLLISREKTDAAPPIAGIQSVNGRTIQATQEPTPYVMVVADAHVRGKEWVKTAQNVIANLSVKTAEDLLPELGENAHVSQVQLYRWENADGPYYAVDSVFDEETGEFKAKQFFEKTDRRKKSGYTDTERYFLNALLGYSRDKGLSPHEEFTDATWDDVMGVIATLHNKAEELASFDTRAALHVQQEIIPLVSGYAQALQLAEYDPSFFFSSNFTMDTGSSANQGRGLGEFKGLAATPDTPMSPWEDRFFGDTSIVTQRNTFWKWSPNPGIVMHTDTGFRGTPQNPNAITVCELHPRTFSTQSPDGTHLPEYTLSGVESEIITIDDAIKQFLQPGLNAQAAAGIN